MFANAVMLRHFDYRKNSCVVATAQSQALITTWSRLTRGFSAQYPRVIKYTLTYVFLTDKNDESGFESF